MNMHDTVSSLWNKVNGITTNVNIIGILQIWGVTGAIYTTKDILKASTIQQL